MKKWLLVLVFVGSVVATQAQYKATFAPFVKTNAPGYQLEVDTDLITACSTWNAPTNYVEQMQQPFAVTATSVGLLLQTTPASTATNELSFLFQTSLDKTNWTSLTNVTWAMTNVTEPQFTSTGFEVGEAGWIRLYNITNYGVAIASNIWFRYSYK